MRIEIYAIPIGFEIYAAVGQKNFLKDGFHINKNSKNKEAAKAFIGTALSEENEGDGGALPVNLDALTE